MQKSISTYPKHFGLLLIRLEILVAYLAIDDWWQSTLIKMLLTCLTLSFKFIYITDDSRDMLPYIIPNLSGDSLSPITINCWAASHCSPLQNSFKWKNNLRYYYVLSLSFRLSFGFVVFYYIHLLLLKFWYFVKIIII